MRIAMVAGETSGDLLGQGLIRCLKKKYPNATFEGIAGPRMQAEGCRSMHAMERLSVMGIFNVLAKAPGLLMLRRELIAYWSENPPDLFIGVDAPEFNIGLEHALKKKGVITCHYVSPSVWAWRSKRIHKIKAAVDLMLVLFPFEESFYQSHGVRVSCVGHPLADQIPLDTDREQAKNVLNVSSQEKVLAVLPGSRMSEVSLLSETFFNTINLLRKSYPELKILIPCVNEKIKNYLVELENQMGGLNVEYVDFKKNREVMMAADCILLASGTAALEAALLKRPMVVAYKVTKMTYMLAKRLVKINHFSIPNLLVGRNLVPEFIQDAAEPEQIYKAIIQHLKEPVNQALYTEYSRIHKLLKRDADIEASSAIIRLLEDKAASQRQQVC